MFRGVAWPLGPWKLRFLCLAPADWVRGGGGGLEDLKFTRPFLNQSYCFGFVTSYHLQPKVLNEGVLMCVVCHTPLPATGVL